ncbi:hypothetical protein LCGC14_2581990 [marine sediment metagenome]|uniref:Uncharacterized protein n=1 Tax=marine sediment metagenome TaxID=412755 RepID=A0A0F9D6X4_9ZZZZ
MEFIGLGIVVGIVALWFVMNRWVLPRFGVNT